jgi:hypothetical protein
MKDRCVLRIDRIIAPMALNGLVRKGGLALAMIVPFNGRRP